MTGLETILVLHYEVQDFTAEDVHTFSHWDNAEKFYDQLCEDNPRHEIKLVAVAASSFA